MTQHEIDKMLVAAILSIILTHSTIINTFNHMFSNIVKSCIIKMENKTYCTVETLPKSIFEIR